MTAVRTKDKLFLIVVVPAVLAAAYAYFWRMDAAKRIERLETRRDSLVSEEDFPFEKAAAERRLASAREELERERATPPAELGVRARADATPAERERDVLRVFGECGLGIVRSNVEGTVEELQSSSPASVAGGVALRETGFRPEPVLRRYVLDGSYPAVKRALDRFASEKLAVVPARVEMRDAERERWTLALWL